MGTVHGAFADCRNYLPGMFVAVDNYDVINFLYKEAYGSGLYTYRISSYKTRGYYFFSEPSTVGNIRTRVLFEAWIILKDCQ